MSAPENPLLPLVLQLLRAAPTGISEYEILKRIEADGSHFVQVTDDSQLALFQKHFLIMNALYRLQESLWRDEYVWLTISPLRIVIEAIDTAAAEQKLSVYSDDALRAYYLDWQQFIATDSDAVANLIASFWLRYNSHDWRADALATLQLDHTADIHQIKQQYRRLAAATHPDRGGDAAQFLAIRAAYEILRKF